VNIRPLTSEDADTVSALWQEFVAEMPQLPFEQEDWSQAWSDLSRHIEEGIGRLAEEDGNALGYVTAKFERWGPKTVYVTDLYVRPEARRRGIGKALLAEVVAASSKRGSTHVLLDVASENRDALLFYDRLGFRERAKIMFVDAPTLGRQTAEREAGETLGAVHVQTDDAQSVERVVRDYLPRLSAGTSAEFESGRAWTIVRVEPFDGDALRKLGAELSYRFGVTVLLTLEDGAVVRFVIHDRGRMVDEYLSVPEYFGPLPPGDALALRANPTVVSRLTGAEPARVRAVARTADRPGELPPAAGLYAQIAELMGLHS
jgi:ribosomal protein S18 acetylase RimI-like enzyme